MIFSKRIIYFILLLVLNLLLLIGISDRKNTFSHYITTFTNGVRLGTGYSIQLFQKFFSYFENSIQLQKKNERLEEEIATYQSNFKSIDILMRENIKLKELLEFQYSIDYNLILSHIIITTIGEGRKEYVVDKGRLEGIVKDMIVCGIFEQRLVLLGKIISVHPHTSVVESIQQYNHSFGVISSTSQKKAMLLGKNNTISIVFDTIYEVNSVLVGEEVEVHEYSTLYPRGIPVGTIVNITTDNETFLITGEVQPFLTLEDVDVVLIMQPQNIYE